MERNQTAQHTKCTAFQCRIDLSAHQWRLSAYGPTVFVRVYAMLAEVQVTEAEAHGLMGSGGLGSYYQGDSQESWVVGRPLFE